MILPILLSISFFFCIYEIKSMQTSDSKFLALSEALQECQSTPHCCSCKEEIKVPIETSIVACPKNHLHHGACAYNTSLSSSFCECEIVTESPDQSKIDSLINQIRLQQGRCPGCCDETIVDGVIAIAPCGHFNCLECQINFEHFAICSPRIPLLSMPMLKCGACQHTYKSMINPGAKPSCDIILKRMLCKSGYLARSWWQMFCTMYQQPETVWYCAGEMMRQASGMEN